MDVIEDPMTGTTHFEEADATYKIRIIYWLISRLAGVAQINLHM